MRPRTSGFSLIEMMVAVALFAIVMLVATGSLLALIDADRKSQALQSVMGNLNIALDGMVRAIRMGSTYHCGGGSYSTVQDCASSSDLPENHYVLAFEPINGNSNSTSDQWVYSYDASAKRLYKSEDGGTSFIAITAPEVTIDEMQFYVVGSTRGDTVQPKVVITIKGTAGAQKLKTRTTFNIQATAVQRMLDI